MLSIGLKPTLLFEAELFAKPCHSVLYCLSVESMAGVVPPDRLRFAGGLLQPLGGFPGDARILVSALKQQRRGRGVPDVVDGGHGVHDREAPFQFIAGQWLPCLDDSLHRGIVDRCRRRRQCERPNPMLYTCQHAADKRAETGP